MYGDLAQMSKARGIYRTLALLAVLSHKPVENENNKYSPIKENHKTDEQVSLGDVGVKNECVALPR